MKILGLVGWSGSGKTTLLTAMLPLIFKRGVRVSTIKHAHHGLEFDQPGKDSHRHAQAGARETILANAGGFALFGGRGTGRSPDLAALLSRLAPVDLVLVEGFKTEAVPKLEVFRPSLGRPPLWPAMEVMAVAADAPLPGCPVPVLPLNDPAAVTDFVLRRLGLNMLGAAEE